MYGYAPNGTGVVAEGGHLALNVIGRARFNRSGTVVIAATKTTTVNMAGVTTASMVLCTAQQDAASFVKSAIPSAGSFTIRLSKNAPSGGLKVAYFVLN